MKLICLISGGIDSPVAAHLMLKKNFEIIFLHFDNKPFTDGKNLEKTRKLVKKLAKIHQKKFRFYTIQHGKPCQEALLKNCDHKKLCVICRRFMYRSAEELAKKEKAAALLTGENLGQVASQTLDNLYVESQAVKIPVLRPLIGLDKEEIIQIAKKIGTYETSILPGMCCNLVPKYPETHADLGVIKAEEKELDIKNLVDKSVRSAEVLEI